MRPLPRLTLLARLRRDRRGTAAIEFAVLAPLLVLLLVATVELGFMMRAKILAEEAASAGALYASQHSFNATAIANAVTSASSEAAISATPAPADWWGCPSTTAITAVAAGSLCGDGKAARHYVTVSAAAPRTSILGSSFDLPANATASSVVRLP
ncbi:TadE/TadG family type IV pilus assembly protein [Phenylobacterium soli]|uniref:Pilus assembly protein n=1 Tax=Phenylobacterium soli TaxID=2170551 RepID=A0A328ALT5_9CAUL|nr:TadE/TadG family type IV pilus assembly protein [Phenylobacterium soli]RAK55923.1 pilus assembly protein [Phenylobacterium soli]